jgi:hypothetical protein
MRSVRSVLYQNEKNANAVSSPVPELEYLSPVPEFYGIGLRCLMTDGIPIPAVSSRISMPSYAFLNYVIIVAFYCAHFA